MQIKPSSLVLTLIVSLLLPTTLVAQRTPLPGDQQIPSPVLITIVKAEDERRWDGDLAKLLSNEDAAVRERALLAAGRIGDDAAVQTLVTLMETDAELNVRAMAAFALGEIESGKAIPALIKQTQRRSDGETTARAVEALGKIAAALPKSEAEQAKAAGSAILEALSFEARRRSQPDKNVIQLGLTAALRARPEGAGKIIAEFLTYSDPIPAHAANALARLRANDGNSELRKLLSTATDPILRANAARVLGATEDKESFAGLLDRALRDEDMRVRVSSIRALASLKDPRATQPLVDRTRELHSAHKPNGGPDHENELLEVAAALGRTAVNTRLAGVISALQDIGALTGWATPEVNVALARVQPASYAGNERRINQNWRSWSAWAQGAGELATAKSGSAMADASARSEALIRFRSALNCPPLPPTKPKVKVKAGTVIGSRCRPIPTLALSDYLRAYAAFKEPDLLEILKKHLLSDDEVVRGTVADLIAEMPASDANTKILISALPSSLADKDSNDAALSILSALGKQKNAAANDAIKTALNSHDYLIKRRAVTLLKENGAGDYSARLGPIKTGNTLAVYRRAIDRLGRDVRARVSTNRGDFVIELLPAEAPLNVDNFIQLARRGYFRNLTFHRVVPNFVIQGGDPRGDGSGGPGYAIRCEVNRIQYDRAIVGMALSGKDTGGSQWFVTHSPQPHLDGGYTVFGKVISGMKVVDEITRGDVIRSISITEMPRR